MQKLKSLKMFLVVLFCVEHCISTLRVQCVLLACYQCASSSSLTLKEEGAFSVYFSVCGTVSLVESFYYTISECVINVPVAAVFICE